MYKIINDIYVHIILNYLSRITTVVSERTSHQYIYLTSFQVILVYTSNSKQLILVIS